MLFYNKFQCTVSGVHGVLLQAALDSVTRPAMLPGHLRGLSFNKLSMEETNALVPVPRQNTATQYHVQVRRMAQLYPSCFSILVMLFYNKFQYTVSGVHGVLVQAALDSVTKPAAGVPGHLQGLLFHICMYGTNALVPLPRENTATHNHVQVRRMAQLCPSCFLVLVMLFYNKFQCTVSGVHGVLLQAALDSVPRPAAGVPGQLPGLLFHKLSIGVSIALVQAPEQRAATPIHVKVRRVVQLKQLEG